MDKINKTVHPFFRIILILLCLNIIAGCKSTPSSTRWWTKAKDCKNVAILLPENEAERYDKYDYPMLKEEIDREIPGVTLQYFNAKGVHKIQEAQAEAALINGACILVLGPVDGEEAKAIVQTAKEKNNVPVIAYDRLIQDNDTAFYVSFDGNKVGKIQGEYIEKQYKEGAYGLKKGAKLIMIHGDKNDPNALAFRKGLRKQLQPFIDSGDLKELFDAYTLGWKRDEAKKQIVKLLNENNNDIQIAYVANDNMANGVIEVLRTRNLNGKVLVTGQDAELRALRNILKGDQAMTVYKSYRQEAAATAKVVGALSKGMDIKEISNGTIKTATGGEILSFIIDPIAIDKSNISIVIEDGFVTKAELCEGITGENCE